MIRIAPYKISGGIELDLRKELNRFMFGASDEVAKGALAIFRRMRRLPGVEFPKKSEDLQVCPCKSESLENEPDRDYPCDICFGEGYLFDDEIVVVRKTNRFEYQDTEKYNQWGKNTVAMSFFYIEYHRDISRFDKLIEPVHTREGAIASPIRILHVHNIHMAEEFRSDYGRIEYVRAACFTD